jgi:microcystin-dependent protein
MGTTPTYGLRYPDPSMAADVPADMQILATDTENTVKGQVDPLLARVAALETQLGSFPVADPGDLRVSARPAPSAGWLLCDGAAVSRTTYSALFQAIGTAYGAGDGSTTFNLPDYRGRTIVGVGPHADVNGRGLNEGSLPGNRRPRHKHTVGDDTPDHAHHLTIANHEIPYNINTPGYTQGTGPHPTVTNVFTDGANTRHRHPVGPQSGTEPVDSAAYQTANIFIKT